MTECNTLKGRLDGASSFDEAREIVSTALACAPRAELLEFIKVLYLEFKGPDPSGGEVGTLDHIRRITNSIALSDHEIESWGENPKDFRAILAHA